MFRLAIIGPGAIAQTYGEALKGSQTVQICAIAGHDTEKGRKLAEDYRVPYYTDQDELYYKEKPDAVLICTPTFTHEEIVRKALEHKVHVMCEKPFVFDEKTAEELFAAAKQLGVKLMVMQVLRFWPEYVKLKEMIDAGELGVIKNVYLSRLSSHPDWATWHKDPKKSGGGLYDLHIHDIDYLYHVFGRVESVYALGYQEKSGCYNNVSTMLKFTNGVSAVVEGFMDMTGAYSFTTDVRVNGEKAAVEYLNKSVYLRDGGTAKTGRFVVYPKDEAAKILEIPKKDPYAKEVEYFAACVREGKETELVPSEDVVDVLRILGAIHRSLESGELVKL